ncbi:protein TsetseEP-like [Dermacentor albipictus]|uniref:protein TsetseEP-like n=1 Tax=Dermacentor albipictus TaxID=60249 RepID=UPI0031FDAC14
MARDHSTRREAVAALRKQRSRRRRTSKNTDASVKSAPRPTTPPSLPSTHGEVESKVVPHNTDTEAWPVLPKRQPPPQPKKLPGPQPMSQLKLQLKLQPEPQPKPQPEPRLMPQPMPQVPQVSQPLPQPEPQSHQRIQHTVVESTAPTPDKVSKKTSK